jgi:antagonist of KipI
MNLRVITPGLLTTVQDRGRDGHQHLGIPVSGAMDEIALLLGNLLVGNEPDAAGLECTLMGPVVSFDEPTLVAITGGQSEPHCGDTRIPTWRTTLLPAKTELSIGSMHGVGCRAYLAIAGGIDTPCVLDSRSTYSRAALGGHEGRPLRAGDLLPIGTPTPRSVAIAAALDTGVARTAVAGWGIARDLAPRYSRSPLVRVVPETGDAAVEACADALFAQTFTIAPQSDRMGFRLQGKSLDCSPPAERLSEAVALGTIQLPPGGAPIVLMADRQTTGGYPRLGAIASVDVPLVAQLAPGDSIRFAPISLAEAQRLYLAREQDLVQARTALALRFHA